MDESTNDSSTGLDRAIAYFFQAEDSGSPLSRTSFLAKYPDLREELTEFLDNHFSVTDLTSSQRGNRTDRPSSRMAPGDRFAGYEILAVAGVGGSSVVYHARQLNPPREVALKIIASSPEKTAMTLARYKQEVAAIVKLSHPSVAAIYEVGEFNNLLYYSTEWLSGGTLEGQFGEYRQQPLKAARVILELALAVAHAHARGIIHRDLKPSNVLLGPDGQPKLVDFGLASEIDRQVVLTRSGEAVGTPHYMAPEQASSRRGPITVATDVHGLGACLYACLTGEPPFPGEDLLDVLNASVNHVPPSVRSRNPAVPRDLAAVCGKCLEKDPQRRYRQVTELADDLKRFLSDHPTFARPPSLPRRMALWAHRHPALASVSAVFCLSLMLIGLSLIATLRARDDARVASKVAEVSQFYTTLQRIQARRLDPRSGWTRDNLTELKELAQSKLATENVEALRSEAAAALGGLDLVRQDDLGVGFEGYSVAAHPTDPAIAVTEKQSVRSRPSSRVRVFHSETGVVVKDFEVPDDEFWERKKKKSDYCECVAISPDGQWLVAGSRSGRVHVFDWNKPSHPITSIQNHTSPIENFTFTDSSTLLFVSSGESFTCHHKEMGWKQIGPSSIFGAALFPKQISSNADFSPQAFPFNSWDPREHLRKYYTPWSSTIDESSNIYTFHTGGNLRFTQGNGIELIDSRTGKVLISNHMNDDTIISTGTYRRMFFPQNRSYFAISAEMANRLRLWDLTNFRPALNYVSLDNGSCMSDFSSDGRRLFVVGERGVRAFQLPGPVVQDSAYWSPREILDFDITHDGEIALNHSVPPESHGESVTSLEIRSASGKVKAIIQNSTSRFALGRDWLATEQIISGLFELHRFSTPQESIVIPGITDFEDLQVSPAEDLWIATGDGAHKFNPSTRNVVASWRNHAIPRGQGMTIQRIAVGPTTVLLGRRDGAVIALDTNATERVTRKFFNSPVTAVGQQATGDFAVVGSFDGDLRFVTLPATESTREVSKGHADAVTSVAISPTGLVATGSADRTVKLWSQSGEPILTLFFSTGVKKVRFSADGHELLALVSGERALRRWRLATLAQGLHSLGFGSNHFPNIK